MSAKHGNLSINSDNIFPIIKKWMYSDHDIFVRELVSNGCDAITKLKKLDGMGEYTLPDDYKAAIQVIVNPDEKTLKFIDNGIGMTADEVEEYITQIAFSGATEFLEKYKDKTNSDQMIGHFGLGDDFNGSFTLGLSNALGGGLVNGLRGDAGAGNGVNGDGLSRNDGSGQLFQRGVQQTGQQGRTAQQVQHAEPDDFLRHGNGSCHGQHHRAGRREQAVLKRAAG